MSLPPAIGGCSSAKSPHHRAMEILWLLFRLLLLVLVAGIIFFAMGRRWERRRGGSAVEGNASNIDDQTIAPGEPTESARFAELAREAGELRRELHSAQGQLAESLEHLSALRRRGSAEAEEAKAALSQREIELAELRRSLADCAQTKEVAYEANESATLTLRAELTKAQEDSSCRTAEIASLKALLEEREAERRSGIEKAEALSGQLQALQDLQQVLEKKSQAGQTRILELEAALSAQLDESATLRKANSATAERVVAMEVEIAGAMQRANHGAQAAAESKQALEEQVSALRNELEMSKSKLASLTDDRGAQLAGIESRDQEIARLANELSMRQLVEAERSAELERLRVELAESRHKFAGLEENLRQLGMDLDGRHQEIEGFRAAMAAAREEQARLANELSVTQQRDSERSQELAASAEKSAAHQDHIRQVQAELDSRNQEIGGLRSALAEVAQEQSRLLAARQEAEAAASATAARADELEREIEGAKQTSVPQEEWVAVQEELRKLEVGTKSLAEERDALSRQVVELRQDLDAKTEGALAASSEAVKLDGELRSAREDLRVAQEEAAEAKQLGQERGALEGKLRELEEALHLAQAQIAQSGEEAARHAAERTELEVSAACLRTEVERLQVELVERQSGDAELEAAKVEWETRLRFAEEAHARLAGELSEARSTLEAIQSQDQLEAALAEKSKQADALAQDKARLDAALKDLREHAEKLALEVDTLRRETVARAEFEKVRRDADKARTDLAAAKEKQAALQQRVESLSGNFDAERLRGSLSQEEKAHGALRIQYRNLENRIYEAGGAKKRLEEEVRTLKKERDQLAAQLKRHESGRVRLSSAEVSAMAAAAAKPSRRKMEKDVAAKEQPSAEPSVEVTAAPPTAEVSAQSASAGKDSAAQMEESSQKLMELLGDRGAGHLEKLQEAMRQAISDGTPEIEAAACLQQSLTRHIGALERSRAATPPADVPSDDLIAIKGIAEKINQTLISHGIRTYRQIAEWTDEDVQAFSELLGFRNRITKERWREQARELFEAKSAESLD